MIELLVSTELEQRPKGVIAPNGKPFSVDAQHDAAGPFGLSPYTRSTVAEHPVDRASLCNRAKGFLTPVLKNLQPEIPVLAKGQTFIKANAPRQDIAPKEHCMNR